MKQLHLKQTVLETIIQHVSDSIARTREEMDRLLASANVQDGGGLDDQRESTREEMMQEREEKQGHLNFLLQELQNLKAMSGKTTVNTASLGAIVLMEGGERFFIGTSVALDVEGKRYLGISTNAPLYRKIEGKTKGESFSFMDRDYTISEII